jgi:hypothetical protein
MWIFFRSPTFYAYTWKRIERAKIKARMKNDKAEEGIENR